MKYDKNKNANLILSPNPIKSLPEGTKYLRSLISNSINEGDCYDPWIFFESHCKNGSSQIKGINFDQSYSPVTNAE